MQIVNTKNKFLKQTKTTGDGRRRLGLLFIRDRKVAPHT